jgi:hypothetical protein
VIDRAPHLWRMVRWSDGSDLLTATELGHVHGEVLAAIARGEFSPPWQTEGGVSPEREPAPDPALPPFILKPSQQQEHQ